MDDFIWKDFNLHKIAAHALSPREVEHAWRGRRGDRRKVHPLNGSCWESFGRCPSGRIITIVWRYNVDEDGETKVFVITAFGGGK